MQLEFKDICQDKYSEEGQSNKIRWQVYKQVKEGVYESVTGVFKCKDFFNDLITAYKSGEEFDIYGFKASPKILNKEDKEGIPCIISGLINAYEDNIAVANKWFVEQGFPPLKVERFPDEKEAFVYIPWEYCENTYYISAVSLVMRVCNYGKVTLKTELKEALGVDEMGSDVKRLDKLLEKGMELGDKKKYIWYYMESCCYPSPSYTKDYNFRSLTHNCGLMSWSI